MNPPAAPDDTLRYPDWIERNWDRLRIVGMMISFPSIFLVLAMVFFVVRNERAHDETKCPFHSVGEKSNEGVSVREESRTCVDGISEHRWMLIRPAGETLELGRRRLGTKFYEPSVYSWTITNQDGKARVNVINTGVPNVTFREEMADPTKRH